MRQLLAVMREVSWAGQAALLAVTYFAAAKLSLMLAIPPGYATAVWPPSGIALAAVLMLGNRMWPGIWVGAALINFTINSSVFAAVIIASGNTLEALVGAALIREFIGVPYRFKRGEDVIIFIAAATFSALIAAGFGALPISLSTTFSWSELFTNGWTWWLGDAAGIIIFAPLILSWSHSDGIAWTRRKKIEAACLALLLLLAAYLAFSGSARYAPPIPRSYLMVPFVLWTAFRFGQRETTALIATVCAIALWYTLAGRGPFATGDFNTSLLLLLTYIIVLAAMGLVLCAVISERSNAMEQLREQHAQLERRVEQRTTELQRLNRELHEDIAARTRAERELRESEQRFRLLIDGIQDYAIFRLDPEGSITSWNHGAQKIFGYPAAEIVGRSFECLYPDADIVGRKPARELDAAARNGRYEEQGTRVRKDGSTFRANSIITALNEETGGLRGFAKITRDITDRTEAEETRARLAAIVESSQDAILSRDLDGWILSWNAGAERLLGYAAADAIGRDLAMVPPERQRELTENRQLLLQGKLVSNYQTVRVARDGRRIDVSLSGSPIKDGSGNVIGMASILRDITELKQAEQALQKAHDELEKRVAERTAELSRINAELEKFAYVASHDLQEPLRTVINFSDMLNRRYQDRLDADGREFLGFIVTGVTRMRRLIDDLLEFSRTGHERVVRQIVDAEEVLGRVLANLAQSLAESAAVVTHDPLPTVLADAGQLEQLLQNLVGNAIKFRSDKRPLVHVGIEEQAADWLFSVRDNGIGLDPRFANRIFEMFQRLHSVGKYVGSGVGLAICKKIVERHAGRIWVESDEGQGAVFYFTLPRQ